MIHAFNLLLISVDLKDSNSVKSILTLNSAPTKPLAIAAGALWTLTINLRIVVGVILKETNDHWPQ